MEHDNFLFEIGVEELPSKSIKLLRNALLENIKKSFKEADIDFKTCNAYATARRLAVYFQGLVTFRSGTILEVKGPSLKAAFDANNQPTSAAMGFAKSCNVDVKSLKVLENDKGSWLIHRSKQPGKKTIKLIPEIIEKALQELPIKRKMRWGGSLDSFVRPVHWVVALMGSSIIPFTAFGRRASNITFGHRTHCPDPIILKSADRYEQKLTQTGYVIPCFDQRKKLIKQKVDELSYTINANPIIQDSLLDEVTGLVEWPEAIMGTFDESFLKLPSEVLISTMQKHQKCFPMQTKSNELMAYFVHIANLTSSDKEAVVKGVEKVIQPRFADAQFFYETDLKTTLEEKRDKLKNIIFQSQLGSIFDKTERVASLAKQFAEKLYINNQKKFSYLAEYAGQLYSSDLVSEMVLEFPDLQGTMGRYYAKSENMNADVCKALEEVYLPRFSNDKLPKTGLGCVLALVDRIDTLVGIFGVGLKPSGSKDPFALRRIALAILKIIIDMELKFDVQELVACSMNEYKKQHIQFENQQLEQDVFAFLYERFRYWCVGEGISTNIFLAVQELQITQPYDFFLRVIAVDYFFKFPESIALSQLNKRVKNILSKAKCKNIPHKIDHTLLKMKEEQKLADLLNTKIEMTKPKIKVQKYQEVLSDLIELKAPIDQFFSEVMVNVDDSKLKQNRLALLSQLRNLFMQVADISFLTEKSI